MVYSSIRALRRVEIRSRAIFFSRAAVRRQACYTENGQQNESALICMAWSQKITWNINAFYVKFYADSEFDVFFLIGWPENGKKWHYSMSPFFQKKWRGVYSALQEHQFSQEALNFDQPIF